MQIAEADHLARLRALVDSSAMAETVMGNILLQYEIVLKTALSRSAQEELISTMGDVEAKAYMEQVIENLTQVQSTLGSAAKGLRGARKAGEFLMVSLCSHYRELLSTAPEESEQPHAPQQPHAPRRRRPAN